MQERKQPLRNAHFFLHRQLNQSPMLQKTVIFCYEKNGLLFIGLLQPI